MLAGFDQAPDFIVPDEFSPQVVIEAKITEDDGTARDKITRVQHLGSLSLEGRGPTDEPRFQVVACIAGRGVQGQKRGYEEASTGNARQSRHRAEHEPAR